LPPGHCPWVEPQTWEAPQLSVAEKQTRPLQGSLVTMQPHSLAVPPPPQVAPVTRHWLWPSDQHDNVPPQPSSTVPQFLPAQACARVLAVQPQAPGVPPPPQVVGKLQALPQCIVSPQLLVVSLQRPLQVTVAGSGLQPQIPATPPPPQVSPALAPPTLHDGQVTSLPQLFFLGPQPPPAHVVTSASSTHGLQVPLVSSQP
jgi:hypothetical protein